MKYYTFRTIIEPDENETFHAWVPLLQGCHTWGGSLKEAKDNLKEAISCHVQGLLKDNEPIPQENDVYETIQTFSEQEFALA